MCSMSSISFPASAGLAWALKRRAVSAPSAFARSNLSARKYFKSTGRTFPFSLMCASSNPQISRGGAQLTLFAADTPASHSARQENAAAMKMKGISGQRCCELYEALGRDGSLPRMLLGILASVSTKLPHRWKLMASPSGRLLFRLALLMPRTGATGFGLWRTPTAEDCANRKFARNSRGEPKLSAQVKLWPTPHANCSTGAGTQGRDGGLNLQTAAGGSLNPAWVEWLMGYPIGWTDLKGSATPLCRKSPSLLAAPSLNLSEAVTHE